MQFRPQTVLAPATASPNVAHAVMTTAIIPCCLHDDDSGKFTRVVSVYSQLVLPVDLAEPSIFAFSHFFLTSWEVRLDLHIICISTKAHHSHG